MRKNRIASLILAVMLTATVIVSALSTGVFAFGAVIDVTTAEQFKAALNMTSKVDKINITDSFTLYDNCVIMFDPAHLDYYSDTVVTVEAGVSLTVGYGGVIGSYWPSYEGDWQTGPLPNGKLINDGVIVVEEGGMISADFDTNNGSLFIKGDGYSICPNENYGYVTVENGGFYATSQGGMAYNDGTVNVGYGAILMSRFGSPFVNGTDGVLNLDGMFSCGCIGFTDGDVMLFKNLGKVNGNGQIVLVSNDPDTMPVSDMDALIVEMMAEVGQTSRFESWDDVEIYKSEIANSFDELKKAATEERTVAGEHVTGNMDTIILLNSDIVIPEGEEVCAMSFIVVQENLKLTVSDGALLEISVENNGTVEVLSGGSLATTMGGYIVNNNTMIINENATLASQMGSAIINAPDSDLTLNGTLYCGCLNVGYGDDWWFYNYGNVDGTGTVILYEVSPDDFPIEDMDGVIENVISMIDESGDTDLTVKAGYYFVPGDINGDGQINNKDVVALFKYVSGGKVDVNPLALDVNGDGQVNNKDVVALFKYVSGGDIEISDKPYIEK